MKIIIEKNAIDELANYAHSSWCGWMKYLFSKSIANKDGSCTIPKSLVERWMRQMNTEYADLPESEKKSDKDEASKIINIFKKILRKKE